MTARAALKQSDLKRFATVAKDQDMTIEVEIDGKVIRFIPGIPNVRPQDDEPVDLGKDIRV